MNVHEHVCNNICVRTHSHHDQQFRTGGFLPYNVSNPHFMPRYNSVVFLMTFDCYISSFTNITGYVMSLTKTLFIYEYANTIIRRVFLFALHSSSSLHNFLYLMMIIEVQVTFASTFIHRTV